MTAYSVSSHLRTLGVKRLGRMSESEAIALFGGESRCRRLSKHISRINRRNWIVCAVSRKYSTEEVSETLKKAGLATHFPQDFIIGTEHSLQAGVKSDDTFIVVEKLKTFIQIKEFDNVLMIDDNKTAIVKANELYTCLT